MCSGALRRQNAEAVIVLEGLLGLCFLINVFCNLLEGRLRSVHCIDIVHLYHFQLILIVHILVKWNLPCWTLIGIVDGASHAVPACGVDDEAADADRADVVPPAHDVAHAACFGVVAITRHVAVDAISFLWLEYMSSEVQMIFWKRWASRFLEHEGAGGLLSQLDVIRHQPSQALILPVHLLEVHAL